MTIRDTKGKQTPVSGVFHVKKNRGVGVTYAKGKDHPKITNDKEREFFANRIKKEISDVINKSSDEARGFIERVMTAVDSLSAGVSPAEREIRKNKAFDNVMDALGISSKLKASLKNKNNDLLSLYVEAPSLSEALDSLMYLTRRYNRYYYYEEIPGFEVYYIVEREGSISMGELTPYSFLKYKHQGFSLTKSGILSGIIEDNKQKEDKTDIL